MSLIYYKAHSTVRPLELDTESSQRFVYLRKNITEETITDPMNDTEYTQFTYDEAKMDKTEYYRAKVHDQETEITDLKQQISEQADALIELASLVG